MSVQGVYERSFDEDDGQTINKDACPDCEGLLRTVGGETTCEECGLIVNEYRIDHAATATDFPDDDKNSERTGAPLTQARHDRGLSTMIGRKRDGYGNVLSPKKRRKFSRLSRRNGRAQCPTARARTLRRACAEIARLVSALDLPRTVREQASRLFRRAHREDLLHGRSVEMITAGCVYAVCRRGRWVVTIGELTEISGCDEQAVRTGYQVLNLELGLKIEPIPVREYVFQFASACDVPDHVQRGALALAHRIEEAEIAIGCNPRGVAGACLYVASRERAFSVTQEQAADLADTSTVTIRSRYQDIREAFDDMPLTKQAD